MHEVICGNGEGQVPLPKIARHIQKMKRQVKPAEITDVLARLKAIDASRPVVPLPKSVAPVCTVGALTKVPVTFKVPALTVVAPG